MTAGDAGDCRKSQSRRKEGLNMAGQQKRCLWAVLSVSFLTIMGTQVATPILGELGNYFSGAPETQIKLIYTAVSLASFFMSFITGTLIRRKKEATLVGIACFVLGGVLCAFADHLVLLILFRSHPCLPFPEGI